MEDIKNINTEILSNKENLELYSEDYPYNLSMRITGFDDEKLYFKFIKNCEKIIRYSVEYQEWRKYLKDVLQYNYCLITLEVDDQVSIEIHHHVPSLFIIVKTVVNKFVDNKKEFCSFDICLEVMELHYLNKIGYIPIIKSLHDKLHSGFLKVPIKLIKGNYKAFLKEYGKFIDEEDMDIINDRLSNTISNTRWSIDNYPGLIVNFGEKFDVKKSTISKIKTERTWSNIKIKDNI